MIYFSIANVVRKKCWIINHFSATSLFLIVFFAAPFNTLPSTTTAAAAAEAAATDNSTTNMLSEEYLQRTVKGASSLLESHKKQVGDGDGIGSDYEYDEIMEELIPYVERLKELTEKVAKKKSRISTLLKEKNSHQLEDLVSRLMETLQWETDLREMENEYLLDQKMLSMDESDDQDLSKIVTHSMLHERLNTMVIMEQSEATMKNWITSLIEEELDTFKTSNIMGNVPIELLGGGSTRDSNAGDSDTDNDEYCPSTASIVQQIQQSLQDYADDGIGMVDRAQGANVVHSMTSETYSPESSSRNESSSLGSVWWNKFIPQDWERYFPSDWEYWNVGVPSYVYHSLGFLSGNVAPPESMIQKNTLPGSCWPIKGSNGEVTLKLAYPIVVDSVSVDHVSSNIVKDRNIDSAPKRMKVVGYPPCVDDSSSSYCATVGFNINDPIDIAEIIYDVEGPSVQTFDSYYTKAIASIPPASKGGFGDNSEVENGINTVSSCSQQTTCSGPPRIGVAAVGVKILENWGNSDFTCLYRVRLHGDLI